MWETIVSISKDALTIIIQFANIVSDFFNKDIATAISNLKIPILSNVISWVVNNILTATGLNEMTMFEFLLGSGMVIWLTIHIIKFFRSAIV